MFDNYFNEAQIVGHCIICQNEFQLYDEVGWHEENGDLVCDDPKCIKQYTEYYLGMKYGQINEEGEVY